MSRDLVFTFQELPLLIDNGFSAGLVNGQALICYWPDGEWGITDIYLEGCRQKTPRELMADLPKSGTVTRMWIEKMVPVERGTDLYNIILGRLLDEWRGFVTDRVQDVLEQEHAA